MNISIERKIFDCLISVERTKRGVRRSELHVYKTWRHYIGMRAQSSSRAGLLSKRMRDHRGMLARGGTRLDAYFEHVCNAKDDTKAALYMVVVKKTKHQVAADMFGLERSTVSKALSFYRRYIRLTDEAVSLIKKVDAD